MNNNLENTIAATASNELIVAHEKPESQKSAPGIERLYCSRRDACLRWGIGSTSLDSLLRAGSIRSIKFGVKRLVDVASGDAHFSSLSIKN